jgi:hypothetical protein
MYKFTPSVIQELKDMGIITDESELSDPRTLMPFLDDPEVKDLLRDSASP